MVGKRLSQSGRPYLVAYGGWLILSVCLVAGTLLFLRAARLAEMSVVRQQVALGAGAAEQGILRYFDRLATISQAAADLAAQSPAAAGAGLGWVQGLVAQPRLGIAGLEICRGGGRLYSTGFEADDPRLPARPGSGSCHAARSAEPAVPNDEAAVQLGRPRRDPSSGRWLLRTSWKLPSAAGAVEVTAWLDETALAASLARTDAPQDTTQVLQRQPDGMVLARSSEGPALPGLSPGVAAMDDAFGQAERSAAGTATETFAGHCYVVGYHRVPGLPLVVTERLRRNEAFAGFHRLSDAAFAAVGLCAAAALAATRLVLTNSLLRRRLTAQVMTDPLTGLKNRRYLREILEPRFAVAQEQGGMAAVLLIGLDGLKPINDARGHAVGDALLVRMAGRLEAACGQDGAVLRLGGDEFAIVYIGRPRRREIIALARGVVDDVSLGAEIDEYPLQLNASVGISFSPSGGDVLADVLRTADIARYFAKADGGDSYRVFDPAMEETVQTRRALEMDLRGALGRGELEIYYQPLVQLEPRRVSGFEALLRWHHPRLGLIMPHRFIPIAEQTGQIASIGAWVLRRACEQAAGWPPHLRLAVNLSPVQFQRSDIAEVVADALRESRLDAGRLELEITEGVVMRDIAEAIATMRRLRGLGLRLALDDFGTGFASLSYLRTFPLDKVKIDASFLADLTGDGGTIVRAVLNLCGQLRLDSLVEGVETEEQLAWLTAEGCTEVQGHWFSPPRPPWGIAEVIGNIAAHIPHRAVCA